MAQTPQFTPLKSLTYTQAVAELESIINKMQSEAFDIDLLAAYTRRATELLAECRARLTTTDDELRNILATLQPQA